MPPDPSAAAFLAARPAPLELVIFDCDGILVDSEGIANRIVARELTALGWEMTPAEADHLFLGMTLPDMRPMIEAHTGRPLPTGFDTYLRACFEHGLAQEAEAIPGAITALDGVTSLGLPWRIASNSSHEEMAVKFARIGITERAAGRIHSYLDVPRGKPAPDIYLAAAAAEGVAPANCIVIEDSQTGVRAAIAAGMTCLGYAPHDSGPALAALGAIPFNSMYDLPALLAHAPRRRA